MKNDSARIEGLAKQGMKFVAGVTTVKAAAPACYISDWKDQLQGTGPQAVARGAQVFEYNCGFCHGADGRGPALSEIKSLSKVERRGKIINHPVAGQIPQRLQANEISDLNEFFESE